MRPDKFISQATELSRAEVKRAIKAKRVTVNQEICRDSSLHLNEDDQVQLDGKLLAAPGLRYFMLHKPLGYVCANTDSQHPTVLDLLDEPNKSKLQIAGRLDVDTTGLVLITDDGQWNHRITSPKHACFKCYTVTLENDLADDAEEKLAAGIILESETKPTKPARLERLFNNEVRLWIQEGKYHQVKRMFAALGNRVLELHRDSIGDIQLDTVLVEGEYRPLTPTEIHSI